MHEHKLFRPERAHLLEDESRLQTQVDEATLVRLLGLRGDEDVVDLGSGTGFYTDRVAKLTSGTVYAVELQPEMSALHARRGPPGNVRLVPGDIEDLPLPPCSIDLAYTIITFHETRGSRGLPKLFSALRPSGRLLVIDWRTDPEDPEVGPPLQYRLRLEEVEQLLSPYFEITGSENVGRHLFAVTAVRRDRVA